MDVNITFMSKQALLFGAAFIFVASLAVFGAVHPISGRRSFVAAVLDSIGVQNTASSSPASIGTTTATLLDALQQLQDQEEVLSGEVAELRTRAELADLRSMFTRTLGRGDSGDDVKALQGFLADLSDSPATSTKGFYGSITAKGVQAFQIRAGLKATGIFDRATRDALVEAIHNKHAADAPGSDFVPIDLSSVADPQQNVQDLKDQISGLVASQLSDSQAANQATVAGLQSQISDMQAEIATIQASGSAQPAPQAASSAAPASPAAPAAQPNSISSVQVGSITRVSATITWSTTNPSTSEVDYSKTSSMPASDTAVSASSTPVSKHSLTLSSLSPGTTYYYRAVSKDAAGTIVKSSIATFTTGH